MAGIGAEHDRAGVQLGGSVQDLGGDIGVRAVAVEQLPGDCDAGFAQFGDATGEQCLCVSRVREFGGVLAGEYVGLDHVQDVDRGAAGAGQRSRDRADLTSGGAGDGEDHRRRAAGNEGGRDRGRLILVKTLEQHGLVRRDRQLTTGAWSWST